MLERWLQSGRYAILPGVLLWKRFERYRLGEYPFDSILMAKR